MLEACSAILKAPVITARRVSTACHPGCLLWQTPQQPSLAVQMLWLPNLAELVASTSQNRPVAAARALTCLHLRLLGSRCRAGIRSEQLCSALDEGGLAPGGHAGLRGIASRGNRALRGLLPPHSFCNPLGRLLWQLLELLRVLKLLLWGGLRLGWNHCQLRPRGMVLGPHSPGRRLGGGPGSWGPAGKLGGQLGQLLLPGLGLHHSNGPGADIQGGHQGGS